MDEQIFGDDAGSEIFDGAAADDGFTDALADDAHDDHEQPHAAASAGQWEQLHDDVEASGGAASDFVLYVTNPQKVGEGMGAYVSYQVTGKTSLEGYTQKEFDAVRRFSDFVWLHGELVGEFPCYIVPNLPEKELLRRVGAGGGKFDADFLAYRSRCLARFINRVAVHPVLRTSAAFKTFITAGATAFDLHKKGKAPGQEKKSGGFLSGLVGGAKAAMSKFTGTPDEPDAWFTGRTVFVDDLLLKMETMYKSCEQWSGNAMALSSIYSDLREACKDLSMGESQAEVRPTFFTTAWGQYRDAFGKLGHATLGQDAEASQQFYEVVEDHIRLLKAAQAALLHRQRLLGAVEAANKALESQQTAKNPKAAKITAAEERQTAAKDAFDTASETLRGEIERFEREKANEMAIALRALVHINVEYHEKAADAWKGALTFLESH